MSRILPATRAVTLPRALVTLMTLLGAAALVGGCASSDLESAVTSPADYRAALAEAPAPLAKLYSRPNALVDGGTESFERQIAALRGYPIVVNKWASWCGPCKFEFPFFQEQVRKRGAEIAFLAIDAEDARGDARDFLKDFPVPYPSWFDPDSEVAEVIGGERSFPVTAFYDERGDLVYTKQGGYASEERLADDIDQYAVRGGERSG